METIQIWNWKNFFKVLPERWWILYSLVLNWKEILFQEMLEETLFDKNKSVRWGIPLMFPNAWPLKQEEIKKLGYQMPQHWVFRNNCWKVKETWKDFLELYFDESMQDFENKIPFKFEAFLKYKLTENSLKISLKIKNNDEKDFAFSHWFHPYFAVPDSKKSEIIWQENLAKTIIDKSEIWQNDWTISLDLPKNWLNFEIKAIWKICLNYSSDFSKFWIWSMKDKAFVCIEPVVWDEWNIVKNPIILEPKEKFESFFEIKLES